MCIWWLQKYEAWLISILRQIGHSIHSIVSDLQGILYTLWGDCWVLEKTSADHEAGIYRLLSKDLAQMSHGQCYWLTKRAWILCKEFSRGCNIIQNPMSILNMALLSTILTVAHMCPFLEGSQGNQCRIEAPIPGDDSVQADAGTVHLSRDRLPSEPLFYTRICMYMYRERERKIMVIIYVCIYTHTYMYIHIYIYI